MKKHYFNIIQVGLKWNIQIQAALTLIIKLVITNDPFRDTNMMLITI